jgi:putative endonuclease
MPREKHPAVYILASRKYGTLYIGVTSELCARVGAHKEKRLPGFTKMYEVALLVHFEFHDTMEAAIRREKQLKEWKRAWKIRLIEENNPQWIDLFADLCGPATLPSERIEKVG